MGYYHGPIGYGMEESYWENVADNYSPIDDNDMPIDHHLVILSSAELEKKVAKRYSK